MCNTHAYVEQIIDELTKPKLQFKKLNERAVTPSKAHPSDAGFDLTCTDRYYDPKTDTCTYHTAIAVKIPDGYTGFLFPRSSIYKTSMRQCNSVGVIDQNYRGELIFKYDRVNHSQPYKVGDRIGQLVLIKTDTIDIEEVSELDDTDRGDGSFGSTGV